MADRRFGDAATALANSGLDATSIAQTLLHLLNVDGAAVSTLGTLLGSETLSATDSVAARIDEVQFDLGEGPCWDALSTRLPVLEPHFEQNTSASWTSFRGEVQHLPIGALFAFPLVLGHLQLGAVDLYSTSPGELTELQIAQTRMLTTVISRIVLRRALRLSGSESSADPIPTEYSRRLVHQATGMVIAQLRVPPEDALLVLQGHAFATGRTVMEVARQIAEGRLYFTADKNGIEHHL